MKINNFNTHNKDVYAEVGQTNPLRWINLKHVKDDEFTCVSTKWKCKDFMNDAVCAYHHKKTYSIYGFKCDPAQFFNYDWQGMPVLLLNVTDVWIKNINKVVNPYLESQGMPTLDPKKLNEGWFVNIPQAYMVNTFGISVITLFIRMANVDVVCTNFEGLSKLKENAQDLSWYQAAMKKPFNKFPAKYKDYLYVYSNGQGSKRTDEKVTMVSQMHNCGVYHWGWA